MDELTSNDEALAKMLQDEFDAQSSLTLYNRPMTNYNINNLRNQLYQTPLTTTLPMTSLQRTTNPFPTSPRPTTTIPTTTQSTTSLVTSPRSITTLPTNTYTNPSLQQQPSTTNQPTNSFSNPSLQQQHQKALPSPSFQFGNLVPRAYQIEAFNNIVKENSIINMPTGTGKTLIAVMAIEYFLKLQPDKVVMFVVPTRALVEQQAEYCMAHLKGASVAKLLGSKEDLSARNWRDFLRSCNVLVGTAEVFRKGLVDNAHISVKNFSLIIFDECHNATGNSVQSAIMSDAVLKSDYKPRILGLTASFVNGALKNLVAKRQKLEETLQARIFAPDVGNLQHRQYERIQYDDENALFESAVSHRIDLIFQNFREIPEKDVRKIKGRAAYVLVNLGLDGLTYYVEHCIVSQLETHMFKLSENAFTKGTELYWRVKSILPKIQEECKKCVNILKSYGASAISNKLVMLFSLLENLRNTFPTNNFRGIVFVSQIAVTYPVSHLLNEYFQNSNFSAPVSGRASMSDGTRNLNLELFHKGSLHVLVSTAALEEGIDVPECSFIVRFDKFNTTKQHVQGSGRARNSNALIYYFDNEPDDEIQKQMAMEHVAKTASFGLTRSEMEERAGSLKRSERYPFRNGEAEINIFNCLMIFHEYIQKVMKSPLKTEDIYYVKKEVIMEYPLQTRDIIVRVVYPSPDGYCEVYSHEVDEYWGDEDIMNLVDNSRLKNKKNVEIERMKFVFVVVVDMVKRGYLDEKNCPTVRACNMTSRVCTPSTFPLKLRVKNQFSKTVPGRYSEPQGTEITTYYSEKRAYPFAQQTSSVNDRNVPSQSSVNDRNVPSQSSGNDRNVPSQSSVTNDRIFPSQSSANASALTTTKPSYFVNDKITLEDYYAFNQQKSPPIYEQFSRTTNPSLNFNLPLVTSQSSTSTPQSMQMVRPSSVVIPQALNFSKNYKGELQEIMQRHYRSDVASILKYDTVTLSSIPPSFRSTVYLIPRNAVAHGVVTANKKDAEQSAAQNALKQFFS